MTQRSRAPRAWPGLVLATAAVLLAGCAPGTGHAPGPAAATRSPVGSRSPAGSRAGLAVAATPHPAAGSPAATARPAVPPRRQLITVTTAASGQTYATLAAYQSTGHGWRRVFGPWTARIGRGGFAQPGAKREGDGRTPSGSFNIPFLFGVPPNPGFGFRYRRIHPYVYWDDDPASPRYNEWVDARHASPGAGPEPMDVTAYDFGADIGYNNARTPGLGSAIFLHLNIGIATAGCVTLPEGELLPLLRWLNPARSPVVRMGVR